MDRRWLIGLSSLAWALMTLVCGVASGYGQMFLGRAGMGLAEAAVGPAAFSLIRDGVSERWRWRISVRTLLSMRCFQAT